MKENGNTFNRSNVSTIAITALMNADVKHTVVVLINSVVKEFCNLSIKDENNIGVLESVASIAQQFKSML